MGLREKTIEIIRSDFDMRYYHPEQSQCGTACCIAGSICVAAGYNPDKMPYGMAVPHTARHLWAAEYGEKESERLQFTEGGWGDDLSAVTPEEAIAHLNGADPVAHFREDD